MAEEFTEPVINDEIAARAELEQKNEIVVLSDSDGSWKLNLGDGFRRQWEEIKTLLSPSVSEDSDGTSIVGDTSSIDDTIHITEDHVFVISLLGNTSSGKSFVARHLLSASEDDHLANGPFCVDEAEKKGATTVNINCYLKEASNRQKTLILDYEGEKGSAFPLLYFAQRYLTSVSRTAEKAQQRRQAITDYFPKLAYILSNVVILIGNDDLASTDYLTRCREFAMKANDGVSQMVNRPMLIIIQNKGSLAQSQHHEETTKKFFEIHGQEATALRPYFSDIQCFCFPHREQLQRTKNGTLDGREIFDTRMANMKDIFTDIRDLHLERTLTHAQWLYLLQRVLPIVQSGKSVSLHTLLSEIVAPHGDQMIEVSRYCFLYTYDKMSIHSPTWFDRCCHFSVRVMIYFLAVQNYHQPELMSERVVGEQCDKALKELSDILEEFQPCEALYMGKGRSSKNNDHKHPVYCYQHKGAHKDGHRTCQSVYGLAPWKEFFGWVSTDVWPGDLQSRTRATFRNTVFSCNMIKDMPGKVKDLVNIFQQDRDALYLTFIALLYEEFDDKPLEVFRRTCFHLGKSASEATGSRRLFGNSQSIISAYRRFLLAPFAVSGRMVLFSSCGECYQKFSASWNRLAQTPRPTSAVQNFQAPQQEVSNCAICFEGQRNFLFVPCGHRGCCERCADEILRVQGYCPFCRAKLNGKQRVHDV